MTRERIENALIEMGIQINLRGFGYISDAIMLIEKEKSTNVDICILYYTVAKINGTSWMNVERIIRYTLSKARKREKFLDAVKHYIGFENTTNAASLMMMHRILKMEEQREEGGAAA